MYILYLSTKPGAEHNQIIKYIEKMKHRTSPIYLDAPLEGKDFDIARLMKDIKKADAIVMEATHPNFELGRFMSFALLQHKPVLLLTSGESSKSFMIGETRLAMQSPYSLLREKELIHTLEKFLKTAAKQRLIYRFNFMMSKEMNNYLKIKAQDSGISQADYIRTLVMEEMENDA